MKLVLVEWLDACSEKSGWHSVEFVTDRMEALHIRSVGWLARESKQEILLLPHVAGEKNKVPVNLACAGDLTIPKKTIIKMTVLRKSPKEKKNRDTY